MSEQCFLGAQLRETGSSQAKNGRLPPAFRTEGCLQVRRLVGGGFVRIQDWDFRISLFLCSLHFFLEGVICLLHSLVSQFVM